MPRSDLEPISGELAEALLAYAHREGGLDEAMLEGAWVIGLLAPMPAGSRLLEEVRAQHDASTDGPLLRRIIGDIPALAPSAQERHGPELTTVVVSDPQAAAELLAGFDQEVASRVIATLQEPLRERARPLMEKQAEDEEPESYEQRQAAATALVETNEAVLQGLLAREAITQAEAFATAMLESLGVPGRDAVERHLDALQPVGDPVLTASCLQMAELRQPDRRGRWLAALDPALSWSIDEGRGLLAVARQLGSCLIEDRALAEVDPIAHQLGRLRDGRSWSEHLGLEELVADPLALSFEQFEEKLRVAQPLLDLDLVEAAEVTRVRARIAAGELRREHDPQFDHADATRFVVETVSEILPSVQTSDLEEIWAALQAAGWLPALEATRLRLIVSVEGARREIALADMPDAGTVVAYIAEHGEALNQEVAAWLALDPGNAAIRKVIEAYGSGLPEPLLEALSAIAAGADGRRRLALSRPFLDRRPGRLLEALGFHEADQTAAAELLTQRYRDASKNSERDQVLLLWRALRPTEEEPRRLLIKHIMIPMATLNGEALDLVLREIDLARQPPRTKGALRSALRTGGERFNRQKQVRAKLESLGWSKRSGRLRKRDVDVD